MSDNYLKWLLLGILSLIWGSSFILMKYGLEVYPSGQVGALRILFASVVLLPIALKKIKKLPAKKIKILFISGLLGSFFPAFLFAKAQTEINSSLAGILNTLTPVFVLVTGLVFFKQTSNKQTFYGMALGVIGSVVLISTGNEGLFTDFNYYGLFVITATVLYGFNLNIIKYYLSDIDSLTITSVSLLFLLPLDALYLFLFTPIIEVTTSDPHALKALLFIFLLGVLSTSFALILFNKLVKLTSPLFTSTVTYLIPIVAIFWGVLDKEIIKGGHIIGMGLILGGIYLINRTRRK